MTESSSKDTPDCPTCGARMGPGDRFCSSCGGSLPAGVTTVDEYADGSRSEEDAAIEADLREALAPNYLLIRQLGVGGMGTVYLAREPALKRLVAVKVLARELAADLGARARFEREAEAVAGVSHPNVVAIYGVGELADGTPYFVMQCVGGQSLSARLETDGPLPIDDVKQVLGDVASALAAAHKRGIIHRDIKPSNILHDEETGRALVSDFGIAAVRPTGEQQASTKLTQTGMAIGTPMYMSPEQLLAEEVTDRTDVYALGLTGYELLTSRGPFDVTSPQEMMAAHLRDTPAKLSTLRDDIDPEFESLLEACLHKDAGKRPSAAEVAQRLVRGAPALLEWPPPGLESLQGHAFALARQWGAGSALVAGAFLLLIIFADYMSSALTSFATLVLLLAVVVGIMLLSRAAWTTFQTVRTVVRAFRLGYRLLTMSEVLADRRGDTGALIAGLREYATLDPTERSTLRRGRLVRAGLTLLANLTPIPAFILLHWLAGAGLATAGTAPLVVFGPMLLAIPVVAYVVRRETRRLRSARRRFAERQGSHEKGTRLVGPWYESFESARQDQALGAGPKGKPAVTWMGYAVIVIGVVVGAIVTVPVALVGSLGPLLWQSNVVSWTASDRMRIAEVARPFALSHDSSITPLEAGRALYTLVTAGRLSSGDAPQQGLPRELDFTLFTDSTPPDLFRTMDSLWDRVPAGFLPDETRYLQRVDAFPGFREYGIVARAPLVDLVGARYVLPFPDSVLAWNLPIPRFAGTKNLAYASAARAAYLTSLGRYNEAETVLRETISFGFAIAGGPTLIETLIGAVIVGIGRGHLEQFYRTTGRADIAARLRAARDSVVSLYEERSVTRAEGGRVPRQDIGVTRRTFIAQATDTSLVRGLRWERLHMLALAPCTNARELLFGIDDDIKTAFRDARTSLVRTPGEDGLFQLVNRELEETLAANERMMRRFSSRPRRMLYGLARVAAGILRNDRLAGCAAIFLSGMYM